MLNNQEVTKRVNKEEIQNQLEQAGGELQELIDTY